MILRSAMELLVQREFSMLQLSNVKSSKWRP